MDFPLSNAANRAPIMVRTRNGTLSRLSNARDSLISKMSLATWYYINEDKSNIPAMVNWIYAAARANMEKRSGRKVGALACGLSQLYRKSGGKAVGTSKQESISLNTILEFMQKQADAGNQKYQKYLEDLNIWYDTILKLK